MEGQPAIAVASLSFDELSPARRTHDDHPVGLSEHERNLSAGFGSSPRLQRLAASDRVRRTVTAGLRTPAG